MDLRLVRKEEFGVCGWEEGEYRFKKYQGQMNRSDKVTVLFKRSGS